MDNKKRLLQLIKIMKIPFTDEEAKEFVDKLSEEKAAKIVSVYEDIKKFEDNLEFVVKNTNPEAYEKAREEYYQKISLLQEEFVKNAEEIQKKGDDQLDANEAETERNIDEEEKTLSKDFDEVEKEHDSLTNYVNQKLSP